MVAPRHIFFDLDHTLWDYDTNAEETVRELLVSYQSLIGQAVPFEVFYPIYLHHNHRLWEDYRNNAIDAHTLRNQRWKDAFGDVGVPHAEWMLNFGEDFLDICPQKPHLIPNAIQVLEVIGAAYPLHIISNGFGAIQEVKLNCSGLERFFDVVITPDISGAKKPHPKIFLDALAAADCIPEHALLVGDSYSEDILGGSAVGMQVIFFNPKGKENPHAFSEIQDLRELLTVLGLS